MQNIIIIALIALNLFLTLIIYGFSSRIKNILTDSEIYELEKRIYEKDQREKRSKGKC